MGSLRAVMGAPRPRDVPVLPPGNCPSSWLPGQPPPSDSTFAMVRSWTATLRGRDLAKTTRCRHRRWAALPEVPAGNRVGERRIDPLRPAGHVGLGSAAHGSPVREGALGQSVRWIWKKFIAALEASNDLESALGGVQMNEELTNHVVEHTWMHVGETDAKAFGDLARNPEPPPLSRLYRHLFNSTHRTLSVVTTNYDRLAEYAADLERFDHYTEFTHGYIRWRQSNSRISFTQNSRSARMVEIWKVHGCLDWFRGNDQQIVAFTATRAIPEGFRPAIVTPGLEKVQGGIPGTIQIRDQRCRRCSDECRSLSLHWFRVQR